MFLVGQIHNVLVCLPVLPRKLHLNTCSLCLQETVAAINRFSFQQFGGTALALSCVPLVGLLLFSWTHTVGAALWAADLERKGVSLLEIDAASTKKS